MLATTTLKNKPLKKPKNLVGLGKKTFVASGTLGTMKKRAILRSLFFLPKSPVGRRKYYTIPSQLLSSDFTQKIKKNKNNLIKKIKKFFENRLTSPKVYGII